MDDTGFFNNIRSVYNAYGGMQSIFRSGYVWGALFITILSWRNIQNEKWSELSLNILPTLTGFSIAAYAIFFAILNEKERKILSKPHDKIDGRSPFLILLSSISHMVVVQISAILLSIIYEAKSIPILPGWEDRSIRFNTIFSSIGWFLTLYGILLMVASILSIFKIIEIKSKL